MSIQLKLAVLLLACLGCAIAQETTTGFQSSGGGCRCEYIEQPPNELLCNPYRNEELRLECTILFPSSQTNKEVVWFRSQLQTQNPEITETHLNLDLWSMNRLDLSHPNIQIREQRQASTATQSTWVRSQLVITNLNDSYVGNYWCRIKDDNENEGFIPSDSVYLQPANAYSNFGECSDQSAQSKEERKCADWDTTGSTDPIPTQYTRTESSQPMTTEHVLSTSATNETPDTVGEGFTEEDDRRRSLTNELYISISILVLFGVMVLVLAPATLCLCVKRRRQGATVRSLRPDLERVRPANLQRRSATMPVVASDYLVPQPFLVVAPEQLQTSQVTQQPANRYSCETSLGHEYEDVQYAVSNDSSKHDYSTDSSVFMKKNEAYSVCSKIDSQRGITRLEEPHCSAVIISNPLYVRTTSQEERMSDDSDEYVDPTDCSYL